MKRNICYLFLFVTVALLCAAATSCKQNKPSHGDSYDIVPEKPIVCDTVASKDNRSVDEFHSAFVYDADTVNVIIGETDKYAVDITGPHSYVKCQQSQIRDKNLYVKYENKDTHYRKTIVKIMSPQLNCIQIHGCNVLKLSGKSFSSQHLLLELTDVEKVESDVDINAESIALHFDNVGKGSYKVKCKDLKLRLNNAENTQLKGTTHSVIFQNGKKNADISKVKSDTIIIQHK